VPFATVVLFGLLWKRTNYQAAKFGLIGGIVILGCVITADYMLKKHGIYASWGIPNGLHWIYVGFIAQVIIAIGMVIVSLATQAPETAQWKPFQWSFSQLREMNDGIRRPWYQSLALWFGVFAVAWIYAYWRFW
jgi:Na+/proline symporter